MSRSRLESNREGGIGERLVPARKVGLAARTAESTVLPALPGDDLPAPASLLPGEEAAHPCSLQIALTDPYLHLLLTGSGGKRQKLPPACRAAKVFSQKAINHPVVRRGNSLTGSLPAVS